MTTKQLTDDEALALCLRMVLAGADGEGRTEQIHSMLNGLRNDFGDFVCTPEPREKVAQFCSYVLQKKSLDLKPWESPPCHAQDDDEWTSKLWRRMEALGISIYHPDPNAALREVEAAS